MTCGDRFTPQDVAAAADLIYNAPPPPAPAPPKPAPGAAAPPPPPPAPKPVITKCILNCNCVKLNNENALVFNMCDQCTTAALQGNKLYAAHNLILSPDHISAFWGGLYSHSYVCCHIFGLMEAQAPKKSIKINDYAFESFRTNNAEELPKKVYFVGSENKSMTTEDLKNYLKANKYSDDMCDYVCNVLKVCVGSVSE